MASFPITIDSAGGEYMESVVVLGWSAKPGDRVTAGQLLVTVETAKAATEIAAERDGWLETIAYGEGQEAPVGATLGTISDQPVSANAQPSDAPVAPAGAGLRDDASLNKATAPAARHRVIASPLARRIARDAGLDLASVVGTGPRGRIKERDVSAALAAMPSKPDQQQPTAEAGRSRSLSAQAPGADPIVLLHGFGADRSSWRQVLPLLPPHLSTIALDLPAHGEQATTSAVSIDEIAFDLSDRLEAMGIERAHLVGHSLGGAAALAIASIGRVAVRSLTLIAPGGLGPEINTGFLTGLSRATTPETLDAWLRIMVADAASLPQGYAAAAVRQLDREGRRERLAGLAERLFPDGIQSFDLAPALRRVTVPTRILWGLQDRIIPSSHARRAPGFAAVHLLDGIGHVPQLEDPRLTARLIAETCLSAG